MSHKNITVLVMDGQGGQMGSQVIKSIAANFENLNIIAVGTNAAASVAMLKAGAAQAATGENPARVAAKRADVIIGPIGIVIADSMLGEVTPAMAAAVGSADAVRNARRILIPVNKCENIVAGVNDLTTADILRDVVRKLHAVLEELRCD